MIGCKYIKIRIVVNRPFLFNSTFVIILCSAGILGGSLGVATLCGSGNVCPGVTSSAAGVVVVSVPSSAGPVAHATEHSMRAARRRTIILVLIDTFICKFPFLMHYCLFGWVYCTTLCFDCQHKIYNKTKVFF